MTKTHLGELFFKERGLSLPFATSRWPAVTISEQVLRNLITTLIILFLITLAVALVLQLSISRNAHIAEHNRVTSLQAQVASRELAIALGGGATAAERTTRTPVAEDLEAVLPLLQGAGARIFLLADSSGAVRAARPQDPAFLNRHVFDILPAKLVMSAGDREAKVDLARLADGRDAYVAIRALDPYPATLVVLELRSDLLSGWRNDVTQITTLFTVTLAVLVLLGAAFHWQAGRAAEADNMLVVATQRLDKALDRGRCGLWDWDIARGQIFWSRSMFDILGLKPRGEFLSYGEVAERLHPDDEPIDRLAELMLKGLRGSFDQEFRMKHQDGHWVWMRARAELAPAPGEEAPHLVGIAIDITDQKLADRLNQEAELRLKDAIENISEAFVLWDANNRLVMCNSKYQQFHNLAAGCCAPGTPYEELARAAREPVVRQRVPLGGGESEGSSFEVQLGDSHWLQINERRTKDGGFVSVGTDITALKQQEERLLLSERELMNSVRDLQKSRVTLEQQSQRLADLAEKYQREKNRAEEANRSKSEFLANMSHELRTPLNAIIGFSEVMVQQIFGAIGGAKYVEYARDIHRSGQYLLDVISDILDMSKIEAGRVQLEVTRHNLLAIVEECLRIVSPRAQEGKVQIGQKVSADLTVEADKRALKQVLINLLANAIKFTPENGRVTITAAGRGDHLAVAISDTGIGIPAGDLAKLGRPFEQVENQFTKTRSGSGLGLAISKSLVELHHGSLSIESAVSRGTTVTVSLPYPASEPATVAS